MRKVYKSIVSFLMVFILVFSTNSVMVVTANDKELDIKAIEQEIESRLNTKNRMATSGVFDAYLIDDVYVCTATTASGLTEYAYNTGEYITYKQYMDGKLVKQETIVNDVIRTTASTAQIDALSEIIKDSSLSEAEKTTKLENIGYREVIYNDTVYYQMLPKISTRSTTCTVGLDELLREDKFPELINAYSDTIRFYCPTLSQNKNIIVRDLRTNYTEIENITKNLIAGTSVVVAAVSVMATPTSLLAWLGLELAIVSLPDDYIVTRPIEARAYHYRYGETYDSTRANAYVTCSSEWGYDYFVVSDQGSGYDWGLKPSPQPVADAYPDEVIAANAAYAYNTALEEYGYWPW